MTENYLINKLNSEDSKKYIAGCIDSLAPHLDLRKKTKNKNRYYNKKLIHISHLPLNGLYRYCSNNFQRSCI